MDRRTFLCTTAAAAIVPTTRAADVALRRVKADTAPLQRVLVHHPCSAAWWPIPEEDAARAIWFNDERWTEEAAARMWADGVAHHRQLVDLLTRGAVDVLYLDRILDEAIARCRAAGEFGEWLLKLAPVLAEDEDKVTAAILLESAPYGAPIEEDEPEPIPLRWIFYTRDIATMTPRGVVLGRFVNEDRVPEPSLLRLAFEWSPTLRPYPIAFDASQAKVNLQGGDLVVVDDRTLFLGVGSLTDPAAGPKLARALKMDVVTVQLPGDVNHGNWYGLRKLFLHLDTVFGLVGPKAAVTLPFVFESKFSDGRSLEQMTRTYRKLPRGDTIDFRRTMRILRDLGRVQRFAARSGEPDKSVTGMKLVDYLRAEGYKLVFVGGEPPKSFDPKFFQERVLPELRGQAANVVALEPGRLIAYAENEHTLKALRAAGNDVKTFPGSALVRWHGGPHCLTLPLERS